MPINSRFQVQATASGWGTLRGTNRPHLIRRTDDLCALCTSSIYGQECRYYRPVPPGLCGGSVPSTNAILSGCPHHSHCYAPVAKSRFWFSLTGPDPDPNRISIIIGGGQKTKRGSCPRPQFPCAPSSPQLSWRFHILMPSVAGQDRLPRLTAAKTARFNAVGGESPSSVHFFKSRDALARHLQLP